MTNDMPMEGLLGAYIRKFVRFGKSLEIARETMVTVIQALHLVPL